MLKESQKAPKLLSGAEFLKMFRKWPQFYTKLACYAKKSEKPRRDAREIQKRANFHSELNFWGSVLNNLNPTLNFPPMQKIRETSKRRWRNLKNPKMPSGAGYLRKLLKRSEVYSISSAAFNSVNQRYLNNMSTISNWPPMQKKNRWTSKRGWRNPKSPQSAFRSWIPEEA